MSYIIPLVSSEEPFDLAQFVRTQESPLVAIMFGNTTHKPCLDMIPLFNELAKQGAPIVSCFNVDVEVSQGVAVAAEISNLPTFIFYTTKLSNDQLMVVDQVIGANKPELRDKFIKGHQVVAGYLQSLNPPTNASPPTNTSPPTNVSPPTNASLPTNASPPTNVSPPTNASYPASTAGSVSVPHSPNVAPPATVPVAVSLPQQQPNRPTSASLPVATSVHMPFHTPVGQMPPPRPNDIVKKELVDIRNQLIASIRRIEHLYSALQ